VNLLLGLLAVAFRIPAIQDLGFDWTTLGVGVAMCGLGLVARKRSRGALVGAVVVYGLSSLATLVFLLRLGGGIMVLPGLVMRIIWIMPMIKGVSALDELKNSDIALRQAGQ